MYGFSLYLNAVYLNLMGPTPRDGAVHVPVIDTLSELLVCVNPLCEQWRENTMCTMYLTQSNTLKACLYFTMHLHVGVSYIYSFIRMSDYVSGHSIVIVTALGNEAKNHKHRINSSISYHSCNC